MKKMFFKTAIIPLLVVFLFNSMYAQVTFNKTYVAANLPRHDLASIALGVGDEDDPDIYFSGIAGPIFGNENTVLTKADANGVPLISLMYPGLLFGGNQKVLETSDGGVLFIGTVLTNGNDTLKILKYNSSLGLQWAKEVPGCLGYSFGGLSGIDAERFMETSSDGKAVENYILTFSMRGDAPYTGDMNLAALRITEYGNLVWHRKYYDVGRSGLSDIYIYDIACRITKMGETEESGPLFALAGERIDFSGAAYFYSVIIDKNGAMTSGYTRVNPGCAPLSPDIVWDGNDLVVSFIAVNNGIAGYVPSAFGFTKITSDLSTIINQKLYYIYCENYANSIQMSKDGDYMVSGWTSYECQSLNNPILLKLDLSLQPQFFHVYNVNTSAQMSNHRTNINSGFSYMVGRMMPTSGSIAEKYRIIKADDNGEACGFVERELKEHQTEPELNTRDYTSDSFTVIREYVPHVAGPELPYTDCDDFVNNQDGNPDDYRMAPNNNEKSIDITIAPTLVSREESIQCYVNIGEDATFKITVANALGQLVYSKEEAVHAGYNTLVIDGSAMSVGLNIVTVMKASTPLSITKVIRK